MQATAQKTFGDKIRVEDIVSLNDVRAVMQKIGLTPPAQDALREIGRIEGLSFKEGLVHINNGTDANGDHKRYVYRVVSCVTDYVRQTLSELNYKDIPIETLIKVGKAQGKAFRDSLTMAKQPDLAASQKALQFISECLSSAPVTPPNVHQMRGESAQQTESRPEYGQTYSHDEDAESQDVQQREFRSVHAYGDKFALCFGASETKEAKVATVNVDAAVVQNNGGRRKSDWKGAIHFQFTPKELIAVLGVLLGYIPSIEFKSHGVNHDKGFSIERQEGKFFSKCFAKDMGSRAVPIPQHEAFAMITLFTDQIRKSYPGYTASEIHAMVRAVFAPVARKVG